MKKLMAILALAAAAAAIPLFAAGDKSRNSSQNILLNDGKTMVVDFYGPHTVRIFCDPEGSPVHDPQAIPPAQILLDNPRISCGSASIKNEGNTSVVTNGVISVKVDRANGAFSVIDGEPRFALTSAPVFEPGRITLRIAATKGERFYGGGVQNGRYSHGGKSILIENLNSWTDGGVASPSPFVWSYNKYGILFHTFSKGVYDFRSSDQAVLSHETSYLDIFVFTGNSPVEILQGYYALTGEPVLIPKFGFYEGHLNAYNRDYWTPAEKGVPFEDGKFYVESQTDNGGIRESLNGKTTEDYQFSARAVVDRYEKWDMPLGWVLPNDGYGAGYGQTETLDGNIENLRRFGDYARSKGVEIGLWTQSDLHPVEGIPALLQRDIVREVHDAGVRVLKTDVAWVGAGYSFGLNGIADAASIMEKESAGERPFIISLDGWAGTQRFAGIWTGDQKGGEWEYIRFHIPTYIGSGLSGQPNITSDMDGIFCGGNELVNIRDFQWKAFTPMQLNMDGWGWNEKYPQALGARAADLNRKALKLKSELLPYQYTIAREAVSALPMIRAMMLEFPGDYTLGSAPMYQYMFGPSLLVAPIYQETALTPEGDDIRNGIYLPEGLWTDFFTGETISGGRLVNNYPAPLSRIPVFAREGAIIPMTLPHNNPSKQDKSLRIYKVFPTANGTFTEYDDDGRTLAYKNGKYNETPLSLTRDNTKIEFTVGRTKGSFDGMVREKATLVKMFADDVYSVSAKVGSRKIKLRKVSSFGDLASTGNAWCLGNGELQVYIKECDIVKSAVTVSIDGYIHERPAFGCNRHGEPATPKLAPKPKDITPTSLTLRWAPVSNADYYEIAFGDALYSTITGTSHTIDGLVPDTSYILKVRSVNADGRSPFVMVELRTDADPLEHVIRGIAASCSAPSQSGQGLDRLFDLNAEGEMWHTDWKSLATPFEMWIDLGAVWTLEKMEYVPRQDAGNGTIIKGTLSWSSDGASWSAPAAFNWPLNSLSKTFRFEGTPKVRYVRLNVESANGGFGSGQELFFFKVPGTSGFKGGVFNEKGEAVEKI